MNNQNLSDQITIRPEPKITRPSLYLGAVVNVRGLRCRIFKIHAAGTVDVQSEDGRYCYRVSGLWGSIGTEAKSL